MKQQLRVLLVDQNPDALNTLKRSLNSVADLEVVGDAGFGPVALTWARSLSPDLVVVAAEEPLVRPLATIQTLAQGEPTWTIVALVPQFEKEVVRKAVLAGARDVLVRSSGAAALGAALVGARRADLARRSPAAHDVSAPGGTVVSVIGIKGGIGKTTLATNLAVSLARETAGSVALVDLDLPFGDVALMLDLRPDRDVLGALDEAVLNDPDRLQAHLVPGPEGIQVLPAPLVPDESSTTLDAGRLATLLKRLAALHDFVVVDTPPGLNETTAAVLDVSALALLVATPEVPCLRRTQACLGLLHRLEYPMDKVHIVLNRAESKTRVSEAEAQGVLASPIAWRVANDFAAMQAAAFGQPVVVSQPKIPLSRDIRVMARQLAGLPNTKAGINWRSWLPLRQAAASI